jgi:hypothetical protein
MLVEKDGWQCQQSEHVHYGLRPYCTMAERPLQAKGVAVIEKIRVDLTRATPR